MDGFLGEVRFEVTWAGLERGVAGREVVKGDCLKLKFTTAAFQTCELGNLTSFLVLYISHL